MISYSRPIYPMRLPRTARVRYLLAACAGFLAVGAPAADAQTRVAQLASRSAAIQDFGRRAERRVQPLTNASLTRDSSAAVLSGAPEIVCSMPAADRRLLGYYGGDRMIVDLLHDRVLRWVVSNIRRNGGGLLTMCLPSASEPASALLFRRTLNANLELLRPGYDTLGLVVQTTWHSSVTAARDSAVQGAALVSKEIPWRVVAKEVACRPQVSSLSAEHKSVVLIEKRLPRTAPQRASNCTFR